MLCCLPSVGLAFLVTTALTAAQPHGRGGAVPSSFIPLYNTLGTLHHPITTTSERAQGYFDQGLRLLYGFQPTEAIRSFQEAARLDPHCAMAYWGIALALGPTINYPLDPQQEKMAYDTVQRALALAQYASARERAYIEALAKRYSPSPPANREALDRAYADAMRKLSQRYPQDLDAATLFADALMNLHPWDYWTLDGQPQPTTLEIVATLEKVLRQNPGHPGAIHYYIHALEASPYPERALPFARRLPSLMPGISHLVHMPSHIYMRVGLYADAVDSNARAVQMDEACLHQVTRQSPCSAMFYGHNLHALWATLSMEGRSTEALAVARRLAETISIETARLMPQMEPWTAMPLCTLVRFGQWAEIQQEPQPPADLQYATAMWHYARGLAFIATGRLDAAEHEQARLEAIAAAMPPERIAIERNTAANLLRIASLLVAGELVAKQGHPDKAMQSLQEAVRLQD
jgi:tetratricopeptide (TPR) repeat protein